jgi:hypothetical protein
LSPQTEVTDAAPLDLTVTASGPTIYGVRPERRFVWLHRVMSPRSLLSLAIGREHSGQTTIGTRERPSWVASVRRDPNSVVPAALLKLRSFISTHAL